MKEHHIHTHTHPHTHDLTISCIYTQVVYVMPSTSGRAATYPKRSDKLKFFTELKDLRDRLRKERQVEETHNTPNTTQRSTSTQQPNEFDSQIHSTTVEPDREDAVRLERVSVIVGPKNCSREDSCPSNDPKTGHHPQTCTELTSSPTTSTVTSSYFKYHNSM